MGFCCPPGRYGTNIGIYDEIGATLTDDEISKLEFGSKCLLMGWNFYVTLIWALKGCVLCFYNRITYVSSDPRVKGPPLLTSYFLVPGWG